MASSITNAEEYAGALASEILQCVLYDGQWRTFGFTRAPKRRRIWNAYVNADKIALEAFLIREFAIIGLAITCLAIRTQTREEWRTLILARILSFILGNENIRRSFRLGSLEDSLTCFETGVKDYLTKEMTSWNGVLLHRAPHFEQAKYGARLFLGAALILEPTRSIFPHIITTSTRICSEGALEGQVNLGLIAGIQFGASAESILENLRE